MIASPVSSSPSASPSSATSSARTARPARDVRRCISTRLTPASTANSADARPSTSQLVRVSVPSGPPLVEHVRGDHAQQRQAACDVETDEPRLGLAQKPDLPGPGVVADRRALGLRGLLERGLELDHPLAQPLVRRGQDAHGEQPRVARVADGDRRDRYAGRHLDDRQQRVEPVEVLEGDGYADHRQRRHRREHPGQVGRSPGSGDDHPQPATRPPPCRRPASPPASGAPRPRRPRTARRTPRARSRQPSSPASRSRSPSRSRPGVSRRPSSGHLEVTRSRCRGRHGTRRRRAGRARGSPRGRHRRR